VKVAFGTDAAVISHLDSTRANSHVYVSLGMTPLAAIQTATINASDLLGPKYLVGSLEQGRWADLIAVDGDPTQDVSIPRACKIRHEGRQVYKNDYATR